MVETVAPNNAFRFIYSVVLVSNYKVVRNLEEIFSILLNNYQNTVAAWVLAHVKGNTLGFIILTD